MSDLISKEAVEVLLPEALFGAGCSVDQVDTAMKLVNSLVVVQNHTPAAPAVKVKPLVWETHPYGLVAGAAWGDAYIINTRGKGILVIKGLPFNPEFYTLEAAKAAAQADYEARILAALEGGEA